MNLVHESIHRINKTDVLTLEHRLSTVTRLDVKAPSGYNRVFCLYFDRNRDFSMIEGTMGAYKRDEYRICYYNQNPNVLFLSRKSEMNGMSSIDTCEVTAQFVDTILRGDFSAAISDPMGRTGDDLDPLIQEFYWEVVGKGLRPKVLVDYDSKSYLYSRGDAQITINYNPRSSSNILSFLNPCHASVPVNDDKVIVHIKWNNYLPDVIRSAVTMSGYAAGTYSYMM
ncbi:MAG: hypothetical protein IJ106_10300 [Parasporobacterium sp.]|nr:hypothetical protein [Parasporobacterium sp.]